MAMDANEIERWIKAGIPDAQVTIRDLAGGDQISQPLRGVGVVFIVISGHSTPPNRSSVSTAAAAIGSVRSAIAREFFKA